MQRLRAPSEVYHWRHGTCIDLSLLLCACLEYVDVWPAMILLQDHAFPAYWRSEAFQTEFSEFRDVDADVVGDDMAVMTSTVGRAREDVAFVLPKGDHRRVLNLVEKGQLVPLESTLLTANSSFAEAQIAGAKNLRSKRDFHSMIDIVWARDSGVTPLPILWRAE